MEHSVFETFGNLRTHFIHIAALSLDCKIHIGMQNYKILTNVNSSLQDKNIRPNALIDNSQRLTKWWRSSIIDEVS